MFDDVPEVLEELLDDELSDEPDEPDSEPPLLLVAELELADELFADSRLSVR